MKGIAMSFRAKYPTGKVEDIDEHELPEFQEGELITRCSICDTLWFPDGTVVSGVPKEVANKKYPVGKISDTYGSIECLNWLFKGETEKYVPRSKLSKLPDKCWLG